MVRLAREQVAHYGALSLKESYPAYKYVSRAEAYPDAPAGPGWFSDRQRRYVMAKMRKGEIAIPYQRTDTLKQGWQSTGVGIKNTVPYSRYVQGSMSQSQHENLVGWPTTRNWLKEHIGQIIDRARPVIAEALRMTKLPRFPGTWE